MPQGKSSLNKNKSFSSSSKSNLSKKITKKGKRIAPPKKKSAKEVNSIQKVIFISHFFFF